MNAYRKLIAALVGLALLLLNRHYGIDLAAQEAALADVAIALATAAGVWGLRNEPQTGGTLS